MHASVANSKIKRARTWAIILLVAAAAAAVVPLGFGSPASDEAVPGRRSPGGGAADGDKADGGRGGARLPPSYAPDVARMDVGNLALALNKTAPVPVVMKPKDPVKPDGTPDVAPVAPPPPPWRYIGSIALGADRRAIVVVTDKQRMVKVGETVEGSKLKQIEPEYLIVVDAANAEKRVDLAPRQTRALTVSETSSLPPTPPAPAAMAPASDEGSAARMKEFALRWETEQFRMKEPTIRARFEKTMSRLESQDVDTKDMRKFLDDLPMMPELADLVERVSAGSLDFEDFRTQAVETMRRQLELKPGGKK